MGAPLTRSLCLPLLASVAVVLSSGAPSAQSDPAAIEFPVSGSPAGQEAFLRGVVLLHAFEYDEAREAFQEAQKTDPGLAMAYWGEAMSHNHPVWQESAPELATAALGRLAPTSEGRRAKAPTAKEKDWLASVELLFGPGDKLARDLAYSGALGRMHEAYPNDLEVTSFYALSLLGTTQGERDFATYMRAAALLEEVSARNPRHPGAAHYLIHAYDDPVHAPLGLRHADAYARIAPATEHALHMPSHIYFSLGMWDEASAVNERSAQAADARAARKQLGADERGFHSLLGLEYSYLQQGRYAEARSILNQIEADTSKSGSAKTRSCLALARSAWLIETRRWADARPAVDADGVGDDAASADLFAIGLSALKMGNRAGAQKALQGMAELAGGRADVQQGHAGRSMTGTPITGTAVDMRGPAVMAQQLEAALLFTEGRREEAVVLARQAAIVEDALAIEPGAPVPVKPAHELAAEMLMDLRRPKEALVEFTASLKRAPRRALSLLGMARAASGMRDAVTARHSYAELQRVWHQADKTIPELKEIAATVPGVSR